MHGAVILRVCRAALGPGPDAEDAWSETFLAALRAWPTLGADVHLQSWLVRVAQRKTIDVLRARARIPSPTEAIPEPPPAQGNGTDDAMLLWEAVAALPERQRLAVAYHYLGGLPHAETAELIGGNADAVRRANADGIRTLRKMFDGKGGRDGSKQ